MPLRFARIAVLIFLLSAPAGARETRQLTAVRVGPGAIQVDGSLDDPGWAGVAFTAGFLQNRRCSSTPFEGRSIDVMKLTTRGGSTW